METGQSSLMEALMPRSLGRNPRLDRISRLIDWGRIGAVVDDIHSAREGRPSYPPLMMVKILLLEQWYNLSDPQMEEALGDRVSFRRFVGLGMEDGTPDHSTISRFRSALGAERSERLFEEIASQFDEKGMTLKRGTLMDATIVEAQVRRPSMKKGPGAKSELDPDAGWTYTQYGSEVHFGYKAHIGVDEKTSLIRKATFTSANVYESLVADLLVSGDELAVYADRAYESKKRRARLKGLGIKDRIMHRSNKHQKELPHWQSRRNALIDPIRKSVEKVFGTLKRSYGYGQARYRGLARNGLEMWFKLMAYNLRRAERIVWG